MKQQKYYWKVCALSCLGKYQSSIANISGYSLEYKMGKTTLPKIGKIFVFNTRKAARLYKKHLLYSNSNLIIFKATVENPQVVNVWISSRLHTSDLDVYWLSRRSIDQAIVPAPMGSYFCDSCTIIEKSK